MAQDANIINEIETLQSLLDGVTKLALQMAEDGYPGLCALTLAVRVELGHELDALATTLQQTATAAAERA